MNCWQQGVSEREREECEIDEVTWKELKKEISVTAVLLIFTHDAKKLRKGTGGGGASFKKAICKVDGCGHWNAPMRSPINNVVSVYIFLVYQLDQELGYHWSSLKAW